VVLDARNGEILALANYPSFDPNDRTRLNGRQLRNRAVVDTFEGNHDRLPHPKTFLNRSSSHEQAIHSKACACRSSADGNALADHISCCFFQTSRAD